MTETTKSLNPSEELPTEAIDDVEAHGLREVAAAASIGAAVIGAGGAALAASSSGGGTPVPKTPAIVQQIADDGGQLASDAAGGARGLAGTATDDATMVAGHATSDAHTLVDPTLHQVGGVVRDAANVVTNTAQDVTSYATRTVHSTVSTVNKTAGDAEQLATRTAGKAVDTATQTAGKAVDNASRDVIGVEKSVLTIVGATEDTVNRGWNLDLNVLGTGIKGGGNMLTPTGTVSIVDASGHTLASAKLGHGKCSIHLKALGKSESVTIHYGGDQNFGATNLQWHAPVGF